MFALQGLGILYAKYPFGVFPSLLLPFEGLCFGIYDTLYAIDAHGDAGHFAYTLRNVVALVIATFPLPLFGEGYGDDEVNAVEKSACS